jgi:hypothetical protein
MLSSRIVEWFIQRVEQKSDKTEQAHIPEDKSRWHSQCKE